MFDSGIKASDLIEQIKSEADIAPDIPDESYIQWLNAAEQLLYSEVIQEQKAYNYGTTSPLIKTKLNIWPLFESQTVGDISLAVDGDGKYSLHTTNGSEHADTGATFKKKITLPAGTYSFCDNAWAYYSAPTQVTYRTLIEDAESKEVYAGIDALDGKVVKRFSLTEETEVNVCINVFPGAPYIDGYTFIPQLVRGEYETAPLVEPTKNPPIICDLPASNGEARVRFEDLHAVFVGNTQLIKTTLTSGQVFPYSYYKVDNQLGIHLGEKLDGIKVIYKVRPVPKTEATYGDLNVMVPTEFIDLVKAKLRGEAYKVANEDDVAAKWLNDYNVLLETFKLWLSEKQPTFGM